MRPGPSERRYNMRANTVSSGRLTDSTTPMVRPADITANITLRHQPTSLGVIAV